MIKGVIACPQRQGGESGEQNARAGIEAHGRVSRARIGRSSVQNVAHYYYFVKTTLI
jgi:hypothetical protein